MTEEQAKAVKEQEVGVPAAQPEANASQQAQEPTVGSKEYNFRRLENEKRELERRLQEQQQLNSQIVNALKGGNQQQPQEEVLPNLSPDDIPEWKHVTSYVEKIAEKKAQELLAKRDRERLPELAKQRFPDFDQVVTDERIKKLEQENPDLAQSMSISRDPFSAAYGYFKAIYAQKKPDPAAMEEAEKILENSKKPISSNAIGHSGGVLKNANAFAHKPRDQLYKEMMDAASRAN